MCGLCAEAVVPAPSKWAPLLCEPCRDVAAAHNASAGYAVIPLGRHALANGPGPATPAGVVNTLGGLRAGIEALDGWRARRVRARLSGDAAPTPLTTYLDAVDDDLDRCRLAEDFVLERSIRPHAE